MTLLVLGNISSDQVLCNALIREQTSDVKFYITSKNQITSSINQILSEQGNILITGVDFSGCPEVLPLLSNGSSRTTIITHNHYEDGFFGGSENGNLNVIMSDDSPSVVLYKKFKSSNLNELIQTLNPYTTWRTDHPLFETGLEINEYFWSKIIKNGFEYFVNKFIDGGYKLSKEFLEHRETHKKIVKEFIQELLETKMIQRNKGISVCRTYKFVNQIILNEYKYSDYVIILGARNNILISIKPESVDDQKREILYFISGIKTKGNMVQYTVEGSVEDQFKELNRILQMLIVP